MVDELRGGSLIGEEPGALVSPGVFMVRRGPIEFGYVDERVDGPGFGRYLETLARFLDERSRQQRIGVFYEVPSLPTVFDLSRIKALAKILMDRRELLRETIYAFVMVTPSRVVQGALKSVFWLAPPGFPNAIERSAGDGFAYLAQYVDGLDPVETQREYEALRARCLQEMLAP